MEIPQLVAHRGYPRRYPENTLQGIQAAIDAGARYVEFDVQITADGVPILMHDVSLMRTAGKRGRVVNMDFEKLSGLLTNRAVSANVMRVSPCPPSPKPWSCCAISPRSPPS